jgi:tetratricopeptide (TPR) repeat protein
LSRSTTAQAPSDQRVSAWLPAFAPWIVLIVAALAYAQALFGTFVWDDVLIIVDYPFYRDSNLIWGALFKPFVLAPDYLRPLVLLGFYIDFSLWGFNAGGFHLTNIALHALTSALAFALMRRALRRTDLALIGGLLFALHPVHVEAVAWIAGRFDTMMGLFYLLALWAGTAAGDPSQAQERSKRTGERYTRYWALIALTGVATFLAALAKDWMPLTLIVTLPLFDFAVNRLSPTNAAQVERSRPGQKAQRSARQRRASNPLYTWLEARWPVYAAVALAIGIYMFTRQVTLGFLFTGDARNYPYVGEALQHVLLIGRSVVRYLVLLIWPFGTLSPIQYSAVPVPANDPAAWLELSLVIALVIGGALLARRQLRLGLLLACFGLSLPPVINIVPVSLGGNAFVAERFLYLPSFFFILAALEAIRLLAQRIEAPSARRWLGPTLAIALIAAYVVTLLMTVPLWRDDMTVWTWAHERAPLSYMPLSGFAVKALDAGNNEQALSYADQALALNPRDAVSMNVRGGALMRLDRPIEAEKAYSATIALRPSFAQYWANLAEAQRKQGRYEDAERTLKDEALKRDPHLYAAYYSLGQLYLDWGRPADALAPLRRAIELQPRGDIIRRLLAKALAQSGQVSAAYEIYAEIVQRDPEGQLDPKNVEVYAEWGDLLWDHGQQDAARAQYARYLALAPNGPQAERARQRTQ